MNGVSGYVGGLQEIDHLRLQLEEARERLQLVESAPKPDTPPLIDLDTSYPFVTSPLPDSVSPTDTKVGTVLCLLHNILSL